MRRRQFLGAVGGAIAALETPSGDGEEGSPSPQAQSSVPAENYGDVPAAGPGDTEAYFTEEKLKAAVDTSIPLDDKRFEVVAYNYPSWHPSPFMEERFGKGWTEFEVLRNSKPLYPGHLFPKYPLWGWFNEADPRWAEREIETAADFGDRRLDDRLVLV